MKNDASTIKYFLYARKSTESEDRQVLSIQSQIDELQKIAKQEGFLVVHIFQESRSAKTLDRPIFKEMLERIMKGEANGILCWKLDRLARNMVDGGGVINMLQMNAIRHIRSFERSYYPTDNVLLMAVEFGMANQYSRDLAVNVTRGMRRKAEMGWYPVQPPLGYLNSKTKGKGNNDISKDSERFDLVKKIWDLILTGKYSALSVLNMATNEWGLRGRKGHKVAQSNFYYNLTNPFYYGKFEWPRGSGNWYQGAHEPMITESEYDRAQIILGRKGKPRNKVHNFAFTGAIRCGECGMSITAEQRRKVQKNGTIHLYIHYHCTKRGKIKCEQGIVQEKEIIDQTLQELDKLVIPKEFHIWALKWLEKEQAGEVGSREKILSSQRKAYDEVVQKIDSYIEMRARLELTESEFKEKKVVALKEKERLNALINDTDHRITRWANKMGDAFSFVLTAKDDFENGTLEKRREMFLSFGSDSVLKDKKLFVNLEKTLLPVKELAGEVREIHGRFGPQKKLMTQGQFEETYSKSPTVSAQQDSNLRPFA